VEVLAFDGKGLNISGSKTEHKEHEFGGRDCKRYTGRKERT